MGAGRSASYGMRTVRRERAHVPLSLLAPVHRRLSQPLKVSAKTHNVYFSRHGYDRPAFATLGRRQAAGSAAVDSSSPRPLAAAFRQDSDLPPSSPLSIRDPHVLPACDESECFPRSGLRARATGTIHPLCPRVLRGGPPGIRRATRYPLLRAFAPLLPVTFRQTNIYKMAPRSRKATAARRAVLAAALLATTASAQTFRRTAACPTLGCIFPPSESSFIAGQVFDIRLEAQAPANGSMPFNNGVVVGEPELWIGCKNKELQKITDFFKMDDVKSDAYNFTYYEVRFRFLRPPFFPPSFPPAVGPCHLRSFAYWITLPPSSLLLQQAKRQRRLESRM